MHKLFTGVSLAAAMLLAPAAAWAQDADEGAATHIEHKVQEPKPPEPIERKTFDRAVEKLFREGDTNGDGTITLAEFNAAIDARKAKLIGERFAEVDTDRNQQISLAEFSAWQRKMGSAALSESAAAGPAIDGLVAEELRLGLGDRREDRTLERLVAPITAVALAEANTNYDTGVTLDELIAWEGKRFTAADTNADGWLTFPETQAYLKPGGEPGAGPFGGGRRPHG